MDMLERLHHQVWSRFVRMPQGHLLDYADPNGETTIPTAQECARSMPNVLGWWTPIENGAFFGGLYAYALIEQYERAPDKKAAEEIQILIDGLKHLEDVAAVDGFIARGVADDGASHYPFSSEDQVVPWILAMHAYLRSSLCKTPNEIRERLLRTLRPMKENGWRVLTDVEGMLLGSWEASGSWRAVAKVLYCARVYSMLTEDPEDLKHYETLRDSAPAGGPLLRKEVVAAGFAHDMVQFQSLKQSWIFLASHLGLKELAVLDPEHAGYYREGVRLDGVTAYRMIDEMKHYDNKTDDFDMNWRRLEPLWKPLGTSPREAIDNAGAMGRVWSAEVVPHRHMEHNVLGFSLFYGWIAVTCGDSRIETLAKKKLEENIPSIHWETLHLCYAFVAEAALIS